MSMIVGQKTTSKYQFSTDTSEEEQSALRRAAAIAHRAAVVQRNRADAVFAQRIKELELAEGLLPKELTFDKPNPSDLSFRHWKWRGEIREPKPYNGFSGNEILRICGYGYDYDPLKNQFLTMEDLARAERIYEKDYLKDANIKEFSPRIDDDVYTNIVFLRSLVLREKSAALLAPRKNGDSWFLIEKEYPDISTEFPDHEVWTKAKLLEIDAYMQKVKCPEAPSNFSERVKRCMRAVFKDVLCAHFNIINNNWQKYDGVKVSCNYFDDSITHFTPARIKKVMDFFLRNEIVTEWSITRNHDFEFKVVRLKQ